jgi:uncharacterized protein YaiI (UPF0178 family)
MQIWVDADACPQPIKDIIFRAAIRTHTVTTLVSNHPLNAPKSPYIKRVQVGAGFDVADQYIVSVCTTGDLVITADIPLADAVVTKGATALNPRGTLYTADNIKQRLSLRNLNDELRSSGIISGGPAGLSKREIEAFANYLNQHLSR